MTLLGQCLAISIKGWGLEIGTLVLFMGGAVLMFFYLWSTGKLNMDEGPKMEMLEADEHYPLMGQGKEKGNE